jgi:hypothetical protein
MLSKIKTLVPRRRRVGHALRRGRAGDRCAHRAAAASPRGRSRGAARLRLVAGYWNYHGHRYVWVSGHWVHARHGYAYRSPRWEQDGDRWVLHQGEWARGDRDHDGVPNAVDHHPDNPRRP